MNGCQPDRMTVPERNDPRLRGQLSEEGVSSGSQDPCKKSGMMSTSVKLVLRVEIADR